jgi:hypothetical protein
MGKEVLKRCQSCGFENFVDRDQKVCPSCKQEKLRKKSADLGHVPILVFSLIIIGIGCFFLFYGDSPSGQTPAAKPVSESVINSGWEGSVYQVKQYLKKNLKDPDSLEYIEWSPVQKSRDGYIVRCKYRAKNSFGGYVIENQIFTLDPRGNILSVKNFQ